MPNDLAVHATPPALPASIDQWAGLRKMKTKRTLNDQVEDVHLALSADEAYQALLYATYDEQAVEGSMSADNVMAAEMIRDKAKAMDLEELGRQKLATISKCLGVVLRRYEQSRNERRLMVHGEVVRSNGDNL